jgi:hypothetical protein
MLLPFGLQAQEKETSMLTKRCAWIYYGGSSHSQGGHTDYEYLGDSFILNGVEIKDGKAYSTVLFNRDYSNLGIDLVLDNRPYPEWNPVVSGKDVSIGLREENGRIYVDREEYLSMLSDENVCWFQFGQPDYIPYKDTGDGELVLYDFNIGAGEKYLCDDFTVEEVTENVTLDGVKRRQQKLDNGLIIIEGIGCINSTGMLLCYLNPLPIVANVSYLTFNLGILCHMFYLDNGIKCDVINRSYSDYAKSHSNGITEILASDRASAGKCYSLSGVPLKSPPAKGVYIQGGRKRVAP